MICFDTTLHYTLAFHEIDMIFIFRECIWLNFCCYCCCNIQCRNGQWLLFAMTNVLVATFFYASTTEKYAIKFIIWLLHRNMRSLFLSFTRSFTRSLALSALSYIMEYIGANLLYSHSFIPFISCCVFRCNLFAGHNRHYLTHHVIINNYDLMRFC